MKLPGPGDLLQLAGSGYRAVEQTIGLLPRLVTLLDRIESVMARVDSLVNSVETTADRAGELVSALEPSITKLQPVLVALAESTSPEEVEALVGVIDLLPELGESLRDDIMPILGTLGTVAPDLSNLLLVSTELNEMLSAIPGLGRAKKKFEDEQDSHPAAAGDLPSAELDGFEKS